MKTYQEPDKVDHSESDPDYYLKKFMPVWKQYRLFSIVFTTVGISCFILYIFFPDFNFKPGAAYMDYILYGLLTLIAIGAIMSLYFRGKLQCPKCHSFPVRGEFPLTGKCPTCDVKLKNRLMSDDTARVIRISIIGILVVGILGYLYSMFNPSTPLTMGCTQAGDNVTTHFVVTSNNSRARDYWSTGYDYEKKGEYDKAIAAYDKAIELNPEDDFSYHSRGDAYAKKGEYDLAIADYTKAIELDHEYAAWHYQARGRAYKDKGEYDKAIADYIKMAELDPRSMRYYYETGIDRAHRGEYDRAITAYNIAIKKQYPEDAFIYYCRGDSYAKTGEYDLAIADYTKAIELAPEHAWPYQARGLIYKTKGEYDKAASDFEKVIEIADDPELIEDARQALKDMGK